MRKGLTELVFILDKSGSMSGLESDTIGGFNSMLEKQKKEAGECKITTVLFDHNYELLHDRIDIRAVSPVTEKEYYVGGTTALIDAIGRTVHKISNVQKNTAKEFRAEKVLFVIITDGAENSSVEYSAEAVKTQIEQQKEKDGWEFVFLGANIDAVSTAGSLGINPNRAVDYMADSEGTSLNFRAMNAAVSEYRQCAAPRPSISDGHFEAIREDVAKRSENKAEREKGKKKGSWKLFS